MNELTSGKPPATWWRRGVRWTSCAIRELGLWAPPMSSREGRRDSGYTNSQWFHRPCLCGEPLQEPYRTGPWETSRSGDRWGAERVTGEQEAPPTPQVSCPRTSSPGHCWAAPFIASEDTVFLTVGCCSKSGGRFTWSDSENKTFSTRRKEKFSWQHCTWKFPSACAKAQVLTHFYLDKN